jgi:DNA-binding CsgD family transcriptional regulator
MHEVAEKLSLYPRTVEGYLSRSKEKFGVTSKGDLFQKFNKLKLIIEMNL